MNAHHILPRLNPWMHPIGAVGISFLHPFLENFSIGRRGLPSRKHHEELLDPGHGALVLPPPTSGKIRLSEERRWKLMVQEEDVNFLNICSMVASRFGATINAVDTETRTVDISCPGGKAQEAEFAIAVGEIIEGKSQGALFVC